MNNIVDIAEARKRQKEPTQADHPILAALDALALALVDHDHTWTEKEHWLYETAVKYLSQGKASVLTGVSDMRVVPVEPSAETIERMAKAICCVWGYDWNADEYDPQHVPEVTDYPDCTPSRTLYRGAARAAYAAIVGDGND